MNSQSKIILFLVLIIFLSGVYINFIRHKKTVSVIYESKEHTLLIFRILTPIAVCVSLLCFSSSFLSYKFNVTVFFGGVLLCLIGLSIRWRAVFLLQESFRVKLAIIQNHKLITQGLFKYIRHPSYTGYLLCYVGLGMAMNNYGSLAALTLFPLVIVLIRIKEEEKMMLFHFPDKYNTYMTHTKKIIPFIY